METLETLGNCPLFAGLEAAALGEVAPLAHRRRYARGEIIFSQGDPAERMYLVARGRIAWYRLCG